MLFPSGRLVCAVALTALCLPAAQAQAQDSPSKEVRLEFSLQAPPARDVQQEAIGPPQNAEAGATPAAFDENSHCCCSGFDWTKSKYRYQKLFWPIGHATNPPTGPGYYSLADCWHGCYRENPPKSGYPRFFANPVAFADYDFSYVDDPKYQPDPIERLHRIHLGDDWMFGTGGEYRNRYTGEGNARLTGITNNFDLNRAQIFTELWYRDLFRIHADFIYAQSTSQTLRPALSDRNYGDILDLFIDIKTMQIGDENLYTRLGRQQITLGSQRLVSVSDWGNTMRTFDGVRAYRRSEKFDIDLFWLQPVIPDAHRLDSVNNNQNFAGVYTTYRPKKNQILDLYYLYLENNDDPLLAKNSAVGHLTNTPYDVHTLGFRYGGMSARGFLWESENMVQVGRHNSSSLFAGNATNGIGWYFKDLPLSPTVWAYYDYATGSNRVGGGNTFNQLYPLGHYYLGWMDYVGRANIQDAHFHLYLYPTKWITINMQHHIYHLANARDALYTTGGVVERADPSGAAGKYVGQETDFIVNWHVSKRTDIVTAYSHFYAGGFLKETGPTNNLNTLWLLYNVRW